MGGFTITNLRDEVEDAAAERPGLEARLARNQLDSEQLGVSFFRYGPGVRSPYGHHHEIQEEVYVVTAGSGRIRLDDEIVELKPWDVVRVARQRSCVASRAAPRAWRSSPSAGPARRRATARWSRTGGLTSAAIRVAVCTNRTAAAIEPCLRALAGTDLMLVTSGLGDAEADAHERALAEIHPGATPAARAAPRAVAGPQCRARRLRPTSDVLAFVDDDALVAEWLASELRAAWDRRRGTGRLHRRPDPPRFEAAPDWLSDQLLPVLTTLDHGTHRATWTRTSRRSTGRTSPSAPGPLRDVGGFDPGLGHGGRPTRFGEEDEAQRALARNGYVVRYEPGPCRLARHPVRAH